MNHHIDNLSIFCTTACNLRCRLCACRPLMAGRPDYSLTIEALAAFIGRCEALGVTFGWAWFTGGEPTLWPHLAEGIRMLDRSPSFGRLRINTNGARLEAIAPVRDLLSSVRMSVYAANRQIALQLAGDTKISFWSEAHRECPADPVPNSLPAACICPLPSYFDGRLYVCPGAYAVPAKLGRSLDDPELSCSIEEDFVTFHRQRMSTRLTNDICRYCIGNGIVYQARQAAQDPPVDLPGLEVARGRGPTPNP